MKISIIIIAHNEQQYIGRCIDSLLCQRQQADEIVLIAHNCTDRTEEIARRYPITVVSFSYKGNGTDARIEGLRHATGDIVLCIDGDSFAASNWIEEMIRVLSVEDRVLVGSWVRFHGTLYNRICNGVNRILIALPSRKTARWIWGASMAFWGRDREAVREIFEKSLSLSKQIGLSRNVDDLWLALFMGKRGALAVTGRTSVTAMAAETTNATAKARNRENHRNGKKMEAYFATLK